MKEYTDFNSFQELLEFGGYKVNSPEDFLAIPDDEFDSLVSTKTKFSDWESMKVEAVQEYTARTINDSLR